MKPPLRWLSNSSRKGCSAPVMAPAQVKTLGGTVKIMEEETMKKIFAYSFAAVLAVFAVSCQSENLDPETVTDEQNQPVQLITETITATVDEGNTKATVDADAKFAWTAGDNIAVHVSNGTSHKYVLTSDTGASGASSVSGASASFTVVYEDGYARDAFAVFPASIVATDATNYGQSGQTLDVTLPDTYALSAVSDTKTPCPMIAANTGSGWTFKQLCGLLRLTVSGIPSETSYLKISFNGRKVSGDFSVASPVTAGTSVIASVDGTKGTDDFIKITGITTETSVTVNIPLPTGTAYSGLIVSAWDDNNTTDNVSDDKPLKAQVTPFSYTASRAKGKKLTSALSLGVFSIASGKYAVIAPGNLQATYNGSAWSWTFAANQWDRIGNAEGNTKVTGTSPFVSGYSGSSTTVDLFGWVGASSNFEGVAQYGITSSKTTNSVDGYGTGATEALKSDWGQNAIGNYAAGTWRTPTNGSEGEWKYILANINRSTTRYAKAFLDTDSNGSGDVHGIILFPDKYVHPVGVSALTGINETSSTSWSANTYNTADWGKMEAAGAVFLPAAGYRNGTGASDVNSRGGYWSSTTAETSKATRLHFTETGINDVSNLERFYGLSVRLIRDL